MKHLIILFLWIFSIDALAQAPEATSLLQVWESQQRSSPDVAEFRKLADKKYWIKFANLPYEGELVVLAYGEEDIGFGMGDSPYTTTGYVEVDLVDASPEEIAKYSRSYNKWAQANTFYYNEETGAWDNFESYREQLTRQTEDLAPNQGLLMLFEYLDWVLLAILLYFVLTVFSSNRHVKNSLTLQQKAMADFEVTKRYMKESMQMQQEANRLLKQILDELKKR